MVGGQESPASKFPTRQKSPYYMKQGENINQKPGCSKFSLLLSKEFPPIAWYNYKFLTARKTGHESPSAILFLPPLVSQSHTQWTDSTSNTITCLYTKLVDLVTEPALFQREPRDCKFYRTSQYSIQNPLVIIILPCPPCIQAAANQGKHQGHTLLTGNKKGNK